MGLAVVNYQVVDRLGRHVLVVIAALSAAACAGGGGGASPATTNGIAMIQSPPPPPPPPPPPGPSVTSSEYTLSYNLAAIHADVAYAAGATGSGITVAVIDSGVDGSGAELQGRVSSLSIDEDTLRNTPVGTDQHATWVAGVLASNFNGQGTIGVAYNSTVLSIRADPATASNGCTGAASSCISTTYAAAGIDYAIAHGAKVVNLSFGTETGALGPTFEAALQRGVSAGLIFAVAAGNDGNASSEWPSLYAVDPRFAGSIIVAGSSNKGGALSSFSNSAGAVAAAFLLAPGESVITGCNGATCANLSGTSFATPEVSGAMALLLQAFPNMTGKQVVSLLLQTADSLGSSSVYGVGALDLTRAFQPVGALTVASVGGGSVALTTTPGAFVSSAAGDAFARSTVLETVGRDSYQRLFAVNLAQAYRPAGASILAATPAVLQQSSDLDMPSFAQGRLRITANLEDGRLDPADHFHWMLMSPQGGDLTVSYQHAGLSFSAWKGSGLANPFSAPVVDAFTGAAQADRAVQAGVQAGRFHFTAEAGSGQRLSADHTRFEDGSHYMRAAGETHFGGVSTMLSVGELIEPLGPLGSYLPGRSGFGLPSKTGFVALSTRWSILPGVDLNGQAALGRTKLGGQFLQSDAPAVSSAWRMSLDGDCHTLGLACSSLHLTLAQPLRIESGSFIATLPDAPESQDDPLSFSARRFSASPSGRQLDLRLEADQTIGTLGVLSLQGVASRQPGNIAQAPAAFGLLAGWRTHF